jgi:hypothetical protein
LEHEATKAEVSLRGTGNVLELWDPMSGLRKRVSDFSTQNGRTHIKLNFEQAQSFFLVLSDSPSTTEWVNTAPFNSVKTINTPWQLDFIKGADQPNSVQVNALIDLSLHENDDIKYFSGTVRYQTEFEFKDAVNAKQEYVLDAGEAHQFVRVYLNGQNVGLKMWSPYQFDISRVLKQGNNQLTLEVTNLWPNRLIGDERQYPDSAKWKKNGYQGWQLEAFPEWLKGATPQQPGNRSTFATWKHWDKDDLLLRSGLVGPVHILTRKKAK